MFTKRMRIFFHITVCSLGFGLEHVGLGLGHGLLATGVLTLDFKTGIAYVRMLLTENFNCSYEAYTCWAIDLCSGQV